MPTQQNEKRSGETRERNRSGQQPRGGQNRSRGQGSQSGQNRDRQQPQE